MGTIRPRRLRSYERLSEANRIQCIRTTQMSETQKKAAAAKKLKSAKISLEEMMENLRPFLPDREIYEPEPSKEWRISEECPAAKTGRKSEPVDV